MHSIKVVPVSKPRTPFMVAVPASATGSKRVRRYFKDREAALAYIISVKQQGFLTVEGQGTSSSSTGHAWRMRRLVDRSPSTSPHDVLSDPAGAQSARRPSRARDPIDAVTHRELDAWLRSLSHLSATTRHNYHRVTRRFFGWCQDFLEAIPRNPMKRVPEISTRASRPCNPDARADAGLPRSR